MIWTLILWNDSNETQHLFVISIDDIYVKYNTLFAALIPAHKNVIIIATVISHK